MKSKNQIDTLKIVIDRAATAQNIRRLILEKGYSIRDIADTLHLASVQSVYHWFGKNNSLPTLDHIIYLSLLLNTPIEDMIILTQGREEKEDENSD